MGLWKWCLCLTFLAAVVSDDSSKNNEVVTLNSLKFLPYHGKYQQQLKELVDKLSKATKEEQVAILNEYADEVLSNANQYIIDNNLDPVELPGFETWFKWTVFKGWVILEDGNLIGLSSFERKGDVVVRYEYPYVKFRASLGFSKLTFKYYYEAKFLGLGPDGTADGKSSNNKFTLDLSINMVTLRAKLDKFDLNTLGKVSLKFSGSILTDWMVNIMIMAVMPILKPILAMVIESYVTDGLEMVIDTYNDYICRILDDCPEQLAMTMFQQLQ